MAQYIVTDTELEAIADAIRAKLGSSDSLEWPSGFTDAIGDITGGGSGGVSPNVDYTVEQYALGYTPNQNAQGAMSGGFSFISREVAKVTKIRVFPRTTIASAFISLGNENIVEIIDQSVVPDQWNEIVLDTPIILSKDIEYLIWYSTNGVALKYASKVSNHLNFIEKKSGYYATSANTKPSYSESTTVYGVDFYVDSFIINGINILSRSAWNALTTQEKQSFGLVAIQDFDFGFERGILVNGADYVPLGIYIPSSDPAKIICEAYPQLFDSLKNSWGNGNNPIILDNNPSLQSDGSIQLPGNESKASGYVVLGASSTPFTAYIVAKTTSGTYYRRILSCMDLRGASQGILLYGQTINVSQWGSDTSTGISSTSDYFVGVIQYSGAGNALGAAINANSQTPSFISKSPSTCGGYLTIGRTDTDSNTSNAEACDINVKYLAVVSEAESQSVISQNMANLLNAFILNQ